MGCGIMLEFLLTVLHKFDRSMGIHGHISLATFPSKWDTCIMRVPNGMPSTTGMGVRGGWQWRLDRSKLLII